MSVPASTPTPNQLATSDHDLIPATNHDGRSSTVKTTTSVVVAQEATQKPSTVESSRPPHSPLHINTTTRTHHNGHSHDSLVEPTAKTPLLGIDRHDKKQPIPRIPSIIESSIPTKRSLLSIWFSIAVNVVIDIFLPLILYYTLVHEIGTLWALVVSGIPPAFVVLLTAIRDRKADGMGILMITSFVISAALATFQGDAKLFIVRESLITLSMGILFLFTLIPFTFRGRTLRPFLFYTGRQLYSASSEQDPAVTEQHWDWLWENRPRMRSGFR